MLEHLRKVRRAGYDVANPATEVANQGSQTYATVVQYTLDGLGNRSQVATTPGGGTTTTVTYATDVVNQYTAVGGVARGHDANGNVADDGTRLYRYDSHVPCEIQLMKSDAVVRAVGRCALELDEGAGLRGLLEQNLFASVLPGVDAGAVPAVVGRALLQLYEDLDEKRDARASARAAFDEIRREPEGRMSCPVEAVIAGLQDALATQKISYMEAKELAALPWDAVRAAAPSGLAVSVENFRIEVEAILHEVDEGFVGPGTGYPEVARSAAILVSDLRRGAADG